MIIGNYLIIFRFSTAMQHKGIVTRHKHFYFASFRTFSQNFRLSSKCLSLHWFKQIRRRM